MSKLAARFVSSLLAAAALSATLAMAQPVQASDGDISTRAFTNHPLPLYGGPGQGYDFVGQLPGGLRVGVDRCTNLWCHVHVGRTSGWAFLYALSFGQGPNSIFWPAQARHPGVGSGWWW